MISIRAKIVLLLSVVFAGSILITNANGLTVNIKGGNEGWSSNGTYYGNLTYYGDIEEKNATQSVIINTYDQNGSLVRTYSIPIPILNSNNGTFIYQTYLTLINPNEPYSIKFVYDDETLTQKFPTRHIEPPTPELSPPTKEAVIDTALAVSGLQNWSHDWHFVTMGFLSNNEPSNFKWQYAIVELKAPSASAPIQCDNDWWARIVVDMSTLKILESTYPTMESHPCHGPVFGYTNNHFVNLSNIQNEESPLKQFESGISANNVMCEEGLQLVIKMEDGSPACVTPDTAQKLVQRGWAREITSIVKSEVKTKPPVEVLSLIEIPPFPPGGALSRLTLSNTGTDPISNLNATLESNDNHYVYNFKNVTESNPLKSGNLISDDVRLVGAAFDAGMKYPLIISATIQNETSTYTVDIKVPCNMNCN